MCCPSVFDEGAHDAADGGTFGELELGVLQIEQCLAESAARLRVLDGLRNGGIDHRGGGDAADQAFLGELLHQLREAASLYFTQKIGGGDAESVEGEFGCVLALLTDLVQHASAVETFGVVGDLGDEQ